MIDKGYFVKKGYQPLTVEIAKTLVGNEIQIAYEFQGSMMTDLILIGGIKTKYELAQHTVMENGQTKAEFSEVFGLQAKIRAMKETLCLIDNQGKDLFIYSKRGKFVNQDNGKPIYFKC